MQVAVYCDEHGKQHAYSAICPHMGCLLHVSAAAATYHRQQLVGLRSLCRWQECARSNCAIAAALAKCYIDSEVVLPPCTTNSNLSSLPFADQLD